MKALFIALLLLVGSSFSSVYAGGIARPQSADYVKGVKALNEGKPEDAYNYLNKEITANPTNGYAHCYMALVCNFYENPKLALDAIDTALKYIPAEDKEYRSFAHYTRGMIFLNHKAWVLAESDFCDAILDAPNDAENYLSRAKVYLQTDRWDEAMADIQTALSLDKTIDADQVLEQFNSIGNLANSEGAKN